MKILSYFFIILILFSQKWKVDSTLTAEKNFKLESTEASWINLDISPDKKWIVFDAVGDIYIMPAKGGNAKVLTNRRAWDAQPRFSLMETLALMENGFLIPLTLVAKIISG